MAASKVTAARGGGAKWAALGGLVLAVVIAVESGWAGYGWAQLRSSVFPRDEALLSWVPGDTSTVVIIDPHQTKLGALGAEGGTLRTALNRTREDLKKATGVDVGTDIDKLVLCSTLAVARGRFDDKALERKLSAHRYVRAEHKGTPYLVRAGEDAIAVIDGSVLLYGDEPGVQAAIDARSGGTSLEKNEQVTARLRAAGWDHPLLMTARISDDKPSLREIVSGSTGPRAYSVTASTLSGLDLDGLVESASPSSADELGKLLEGKRKDADGLGPVVGAGAAQVLVNVAKRAVITVDSASSTVKLHVHLDPAELDTVAKELKAGAPLGALYKDVRLVQLLVPGI